jgi:hypothetical protein
MLRNGDYLIWYRTPRGEGTGIVHLLDGKISGRDGFFWYDGHYEVVGNRFSATLITRRYEAGFQSLLGTEDAEVTLTGACNGFIATCSGTVRQVPGLTLDVTLIFSQDENLPAPQQRGTAKLKPTNLPQWPNGRSYPRVNYVPRSLYIDGAHKGSR